MNIGKLVSYGLPYVFCVGGRGTGKTYGALKYCIDEGIRFLYLRRSKAEYEAVTEKESHVFKALNTDMGYNINPQRVRGATIWMEGDEVKGLSAALSTFANIRGVSMEDVELIIFDEFIPEPHARPIRNEAEAVYNMYETVNRNRELQGRAPVTLMCMANSNDLANPLFMSLRLVTRAEKMLLTKEEVNIDRDKGIAMFVLQRSPISEQKRGTALYRLTQGSGFSEMALDNVFFSNRTHSRIASMPLKEYRAIASIGEITIYRHKSNGDYYVSTHREGAPNIYGESEAELLRFRMDTHHAYLCYIGRRMVFETYFCEVLFAKYEKP